MRHHLPQPIALDQALLVDAEGLVTFLEQRVQPVQDRRVAEIGVLEEHPLTSDDRVYEDRVNPFEPALAL